jgi:hypothetical protein
MIAYRTTMIFNDVEKPCDSYYPTSATIINNMHKIEKDKRLLEQEIQG